MPVTLKELRKAAGLTQKKAAEELHKLEPKAPRSRIGLLHIEQRGTEKTRLIKALAQLYGVDVPVIEEAVISIQCNVTE